MDTVDETCAEGSSGLILNHNNIINHVIFDLVLDCQKKFAIGLFLFLLTYSVVESHTLIN